MDFGTPYIWNNLLRLKAEASVKHRSLGKLPKHRWITEASVFGRSSGSCFGRSFGSGRSGLILNRLIIAAMLQTQIIYIVIQMWQKLQNTPLCSDQPKRDLDASAGSGASAEAWPGASVIHRCFGKLPRLRCFTEASAFNRSRLFQIDNLCSVYWYLLSGKNLFLLTSNGMQCRV